jgi:hypothetical protein
LAVGEKDGIARRARSLHRFANVSGAFLAIRAALLGRRICLGCAELMSPINGIVAIAVGLLISLLLALVTAFLGAWLAF